MQANALKDFGPRLGASLRSHDNEATGMDFVQTREGVKQCRVVLLLADIAHRYRNRIGTIRPEPRMLEWGSTLPQR
jgi:hypothetical protein